MQYLPTIKINSRWFNAITNGWQSFNKGQWLEVNGVKVVFNQLVVTDNQARLVVSHKGVLFEVIMRGLTAVLKHIPHADSDLKNVRSGGFIRCNNDSVLSVFHELHITGHITAYHGHTSNDALAKYEYPMALPFNLIKQAV